MKKNLIFIAWGILICAIVHGQTVIPGGPVSGTWNQAGSPYMIGGDTWINEGETLNITPGVEIIFEGHYKFNVYGYLFADGTESDPIVFTSNALALGWRGIRFCDAPDSNRLTYCIVEFGKAIMGGPYDNGGGVWCHSSSPIIRYCTIRNCLADSCGAGIYCEDSNPTIDHCLIYNNTAPNGGGIAAINAGPVIMNCTVVENSAAVSGGGIFYESYITYPMTIINSIVWDNLPDEIVVAAIANPIVTYSDIQDGWPGTGNILLDPQFIAPVYDDYRLDWGSPCIDSGDPNPQYNDPDGTTADMGCFYFDQSLPVRILLTPHDPPIQIPTSGGSFDFTVQVTNIDPAPLTVEIWLDVTIPSGGIVGPLVGPVNVNLASGLIVERDRNQSVPAHAPAGIYHYNGYAVAGTDTSKDSFTFLKQEITGMEGVSQWLNTGKSFEIEGISNGELPALQEDFVLVNVYPNPFNPMTALSYKLQASSFTNLAVYDISGCKVAELVNGWRDAGEHEVTFDGSGLASGVYIYRLEAGNYHAAGKMVLIK